MSNDEYQQQQFWRDKIEDKKPKSVSCPTVEKLKKQKHDKTIRYTRR
jgi:hypothetical protein